MSLPSTPGWHDATDAASASLVFACRYIEAVRAGEDVPRLPAREAFEPRFHGVA